MTDDTVPKRLLTRLPALRTSVPTRIAVLADPHLATRAEGTWKCYHHTETFLRRAVDGIQSIVPDTTLVLGDLTKDGEAYNFDRYDELTTALATPLTVPGNHDVPKASIDHEVMPVDEFVERYTDDGYPFRRRVGGLEVCCLNSATTPDGSLRDTWGGRISPRQLDWLATELSPNRLSVVAVHHNLYPQPEHDAGFWENFPLEDRRALHGVLAANSPVLVVSGHHHVPSHQHEAGVHELLAPALCSYLPSYLLVEFTSEGTRVYCVPVATASERADAYTRGVTGKELGKRVVALAAKRLDATPW